MTTITGNARFRDATAARLVRSFRPDGSLVDEAIPTPASTPPGDYSITVDTHEMILQAHAFDPEKLTGPWRASTVYAVGDIAFQTGTDANSLVLECTAVTGGAASGATEPTWDSVVGNTTTDNEVTWETLGTVAELTPLTQWHYQAVLLTAANPSTGSVDGSTSVSLTGSGLAAFNAGTGDTITVGGSSVTNITVVSDTEITFDTPAGTEGAVDIVVTIGGESATLTGGFEYVSFVELSGAGDWEVPAGVTSIDVLVVGGGGGGGSFGGGGGGGGGAGETTLSVTPGELISYSVGAGGAGADTRADGSDGSDSTFGVVTATGGKGGKHGSGGQPGGDSGAFIVDGTTVRAAFTASGNGGSNNCGGGAGAGEANKGASGRDGGDGWQPSLIASDNFFGAGGGGGKNNTGEFNPGGVTDGGNGSGNSDLTTPGTDGLGSGGGGSWDTGHGKAGGAGTIVVSY